MLPLISILAAYLLGSVSGGLLLGRLLGKGDIRTQGSGNAGATNALRSGGRGFGVAVLLFDVIKGVLAVLVVPLLAPESLWLPYACGAAAVVGHVWPVYFGFRGGKGAATLIGALLCLVPVAMLPGLAAWVLTLVLTGYVGLATMLGMTAIVIFVVVSHMSLLTSPAVLFVITLWALVLYTHRENIQRLRAGNENRFERAMLLRRRESRSD